MTGSSFAFFCLAPLSLARLAALGQPTSRAMLVTLNVRRATATSALRFIHLRASPVLCYDLTTETTLSEVPPKATTIVQDTVKSNRWSPEEDSALLAAYDEYIGAWDKIRTVISGGNRSSGSCAGRYKKLQMDLAKRNTETLASWTQEEDQMLSSYYNSVGSRWGEIAKKLGRGITRYDAKVRFDTLLNLDRQDTPWTEEEDASLTAAMKKYGKKWMEIKNEVPGRTAMECQRHALKFSVPRKYQNWSVEENEALKEAVDIHGPDNWNFIYMEFAKLPGNIRTKAQCIARWENHLSPILDLSAWSEEETEVLRQAYKEAGPEQSPLVLMYTHPKRRSYQQIRSHWVTIRKQMSKETQA